MKIEKFDEIQKSTERRFEALPLYEFPKQLTMAEVNFLLLGQLFSQLKIIQKMLFNVLEDLELAGKLDGESGAPQSEDGTAPAPKKRGRKAKKK